MNTLLKLTAAAALGAASASVVAWGCGGPWNGLGHGWLDALGDGRGDVNTRTPAGGSHRVQGYGFGYPYPYYGYAYAPYDVLPPLVDPAVGFDNAHKEAQQAAAERYGKALEAQRKAAAQYAKAVADQRKTAEQFATQQVIAHKTAIAAQRKYVEEMAAQMPPVATLEMSRFDRPEAPTIEMEPQAFDGPGLHAPTYQDLKNEVESRRAEHRQRLEARRAEMHEQITSRRADRAYKHGRL